jgi:hypothetical protein
VKAMLSGTSHQAVEQIFPYTYDGQQWVKGKNPTKFTPLSYTATVETIAVNAIMAGCKANYFPVVLGALQNGAKWSNSNGPWGYLLYFSGPFVKDIGSNYVQPFTVGNPVNISIGRATQLALINIGASNQGSTNTNMGNPLNRVGTCFAEDASQLPSGWLGQNELAAYTGTDNKSHNFTKNDNLIFTNTTRSQITANFSSQSFLNLNKGVGDLARALGVEGKPGNYNVITYLLPAMIGSTADGATMPALIMTSGIAKNLYDFGLKSKQEVIDWVNDNNEMKITDYRGMGWYDFGTSGGTRTMPGTKYTYGNAPDDTPWHEGKVPAIIVTNSGGDECIFCFGSWSGLGTVCPVDPWR